MAGISRKDSRDPSVYRWALEFLDLAEEIGFRDFQTLSIIERCREIALRNNDLIRLRHFALMARNWCYVRLGSEHPRILPSATLATKLEQDGVPSVPHPMSFNTMSLLFMANHSEDDQTYHYLHVDRDEGILSNLPKDHSIALSAWYLLKNDESKRKQWDMGWDESILADAMSMFDRHLAEDKAEMAYKSLLDELTAEGKVGENRSSAKQSPAKKKSRTSKKYAQKIARQLGRESRDTSAHSSVPTKESAVMPAEPLSPQKATHKSNNSALASKESSAATEDKGWGKIKSKKRSKAKPRRQHPIKALGSFASKSLHPMQQQKFVGPTSAPKAVGLPDVQPLRPMTPPSSSPDTMAPLERPVTPDCQTIPVFVLTPSTNVKFPITAPPPVPAFELVGFAYDLGYRSWLTRYDECDILRQPWATPTAYPKQVVFTALIRDGSDGQPLDQNTSDKASWNRVDSVVENTNQSKPKGGAWGMFRREKKSDPCDGTPPPTPPQTPPEDAFELKDGSRSQAKEPLLDFSVFFVSGRSCVRTRMTEIRSKDVIEVLVQPETRYHGLYSRSQVNVGYDREGFVRQRLDAASRALEAASRVMGWDRSGAENDEFDEGPGDELHDEPQHYPEAREAVPDVPESAIRPTLQPAATTASSKPATSSAGPLDMLALAASEMNYLPQTTLPDSRVIQSMQHFNPPVGTPMRNTKHGTYEKDASCSFKAQYAGGRVVVGTEHRAVACSRTRCVRCGIKSGGERYCPGWSGL